MGNCTALDSLLGNIPNWIADKEWPIDFNKQLEDALAAITNNMTRLRPPSDFESYTFDKPLFYNVGQGNGLNVDNINFDGFKFKYSDGISGGVLFGAYGHTGSILGAISKNIFSGTISVIAV